MKGTLINANRTTSTTTTSCHSRRSTSTGWQTATNSESQVKSLFNSHYDSQLDSQFDLFSLSGSDISDRKPRKAKKSEEQQSSTTVECQGLKQLLRNLSIGDQLILYHEFRQLPQACNTLWRSTYKKLDFRELEKNLSGGSLCYFLNYMMDHFKYVYFQAERLQANLNVLENAGVKCLNNVQHCELLLPPSKFSSCRRKGDDGSGNDESAASSSISNIRNGGGDMANPFNTEVTMAQWPLHALPKMLRNLRRLKIYCEVQVHFIEHFENLQQLVLHADISQTALTGILERCTKLKRLFLKADTEELQLQSIGKCRELQDVSLPSRLFYWQRENVLPLPDLQLLELTHCEKNVDVTLECLRYILELPRANDVEIMQLDCHCFGGPQWMQDIGLQNCKRLRGLVLINCQFEDREIAELEMPRIRKYLVFSSCHDLKEYQLLDMVRRCPGLCELYLIDCPQLTGKVLQGIYRIRRSEGLNFPLNIVLSRCKDLRDDYQKMYANYWYFKLPFIKVERMQEENRPIEDIQIFFYKKERV